MLEKDVSVVVEEVNEDFVHFEFVVLIREKEDIWVCNFVRIMNMLFNMTYKQQQYLFIKPRNMSTVTLCNNYRNLPHYKIFPFTNWLKYASQLGFPNFLKLKIIFKS